MKLIVGCDPQGGVVVDAVRPGFEVRIPLTADAAEALADELFAAALIARDALHHQGAEDRAVDAERDRRIMESVS